MRLLQRALVIFVFKQMSQFGSFGKWVQMLCFPESDSTFAHEFIGNSLMRSNILVHQILFEILQQFRHILQKFTLWFFVVSIFRCSRCLLIHATGFPCDFSLTISLLSAAGFSMLIRSSCDEDVEEVGEYDVEERVDKPGITKGT